MERERIMSETRFMQKLRARWDAGKFLCVGFDPDPENEKIPRVIADLARSSGIETAIRSFGVLVVNDTRLHAAAFKPNVAFFEAFGYEGMRALGEVINYMHEQAPEVPIILDWKRGDIGATNHAYVKAARRYGVDAVTLSTYTSSEAMRPFLGSDLHCFFLARTSNPGADEMQDVAVVKTTDATGGVIQTEKYWEFVAGRIARHWNQWGNCGLVFGATYPEEAARGRAIVGNDITFLVPGIGKQGGDILKAAKAARNSHKTGAIFNVSSDLMYAANRPERTLEYAEQLERAMVA